MHIDTTPTGVSYSIILNQLQRLFYSEWAITKSDPISGKNPLVVFEPVWDGTAFSIDPQVARAIRDHLSKGIDTSTDCGDQFPKSSPSGSPRENQSLVESARLFSVVLEPGWLQRIADA